jgi:signal transduction histidine kinase
VFSRQQPLAPLALDANRLEAGTCEFLRRTLGEAVAPETVLAGGLWPTFADSNQLENAVLNLALNARDAMPNGGKLTIETVNSPTIQAADDRCRRCCSRPDIPGMRSFITAGSIPAFI